MKPWVCFPAPHKPGVLVRVSTAVDKAPVPRSVINKAFNRVYNFRGLKSMTIKSRTGNRNSQELTSGQ